MAKRFPTPDLSKTGIELYKAIDDHKKEKEEENDLLN